MRCSTLVSLVIGLLGSAQVHAVPATQPYDPDVEAVQEPSLINIQRRDLQSLINSLQDGIDIQDIQQSVLPDFLNWNFSPDDVQNRLGINDGVINQLPLEFLNIP